MIASPNRIPTAYLSEIISECSYPDMRFNLLYDEDHDVYFLQVSFWAIDVEDGYNKLMKGRKWYLSPYMTKSEVVGTAFKAVITALEHEAREKFKFVGAAVYNPHFDVDALSNIYHGSMFDVRS